MMISNFADSGPESAERLLEEVRQELLSEEFTDESASAEEQSLILPHPSRVHFGDGVSDLVDDLMMSAEAAPPALRRSVAAKVDVIMTRRRQRAGLLEQLLRSSRLEQGRTVEDVATAIGIEGERLVELEDGVQELRVTSTETIEAWISELVDYLDADVEAALIRSVESMALPQTELAMAGDDDQSGLAAGDEFVKDVMDRLRRRQAAGDS